jgi:hypothetical protein
MVGAKSMESSQLLQILQGFSHCHFQYACPMSESLVRVLSSHEFQKMEAKGIWLLFKSHPLLTVGPRPESETPWSADFLEDCMGVSLMMAVNIHGELIITLAG